MTIPKESFVDLNEKYNKVVKLITDDSKLDPENDPFLSKYAARQILIGMRANLQNLRSNDTNSPEEKLKILGMLGTVELHLGIIAIDTEELPTGEKHLENCENLLKSFITSPECVLVALNMYNQYGLLWSLRDPAKAKVFLEKAEELYLDFKKLSTPPFDISELFDSENEYRKIELAWQNYEKCYTLTLYYLAQVYGVLKDALKSSVYCHITLQRQLESKDYEPIDWALNAATLSQFFGEQNSFKQARHHLSASSCILDKYKSELDEITERNEAYDAKIEEFKHRSADVARCWAKYGLLLLSKSKERLLNHTDDDIDTNCTMASDLSAMKLDPASTSISPEDLQNLEFLELDLTKYESQITHQFILTIQDARVVFLNVQGWLQKAESYYTLENFASDHIEIVQDQAQMYLNFLFFEDNPENQAKLQKRRVDLLENVLKNVNSKYYLSYCRQIWFDLGQTYAEILNIKSDKLRETDERPTPHALAKINGLIEKSIANYKRFIDSLTEGQPEGATKIPEDLELAYLKAYFHIASLNSRYITLDKQVQLNNVETSFKYYKLVYDYCEANEKVKQAFSMEYGICKDLVILLPVKITKLRQEIED